MANPFAELITEQSLAKRAGPVSFGRGQAYYKHGAVTDLVVTRAAIKARVLGTSEYRVVLSVQRGAPAGTCTCPMGDDGYFCKHLVATGLAWLAREAGHEEPDDADEDEDNEDEAGGDQPEGDDDLAAARAFLRTQSKSALIELLIEQAVEDRHLRARLNAATWQQRPNASSKQLRSIVRNAFTGYTSSVDRDDVDELAAHAKGIATLLRGLVKAKRPQDAIELAAGAIRGATPLYEQTDDAGAYFGTVLHDIAAVHLQACRAARKAGANPAALGHAFFDAHLNDEFGFFDLKAYARALGSDGMAAYRAAAEAAWKKVPARAPGATREYSGTNYRITRFMEDLGTRANDLDALIAVKSRDLSQPHTFLRIAELLAKARRHDEALAWAERAIKSFPKDVNPPLIEFIVSAYLRAKRHADAAETAWTYFQRRPSLASYQLLKKSAEPSGAWKARRDQALTRLRAARAGGSRASTYWQPGNSLLVEIFLWEGDSETALAEAKAGGCSQDLWLQIARAREKSHPQDAIAIYQNRVDPIIDRKDNRAYAEAAELIGKIKQLMEHTGRRREFVDWLLAVKVRHKAKRNFMVMIER